MRWTAWGISVEWGGSIKSEMKKLGEDVEKKLVWASKWIRVFWDSNRIERMEDYRLARKVYESKMQRPRCRGRLCRGWMDDVKEVLSKRGLNIQEEKECVQDKWEWYSVCWGNDVMLVRLLCDFMVHLHGKGWNLRHIGVHPKCTLKDECGSVFFRLSLLVKETYWWWGEKKKYERPTGDPPLSNSFGHTFVLPNELSTLASHTFFFFSSFFFFFY